MKYTLMNVPMTIAIQDDRKTNTRRAIKLPHNNFRFDSFNEEIEAKTGELVAEFYDKTNDEYLSIKPKYQIGETIWVREPARVINVNDYQDCITAEYLADGEQVGIMYLDRWINDDGLTVPKWAEKCQGIPNGCIKEMARIFLKITDVRVERLRDISSDDCLAEGIIWQEPLGMMGDPCDNYSKKEVFEWLWNSTAPKGYKWEDNPYVFVYEFEKIEKNISLI